jgi:hypothetical protein
MLVAIVSNEDAIAIISNAQSVVPQVTKSFFEVFGTTGCLLNCEGGGTFEQNFQKDKKNQDLHSMSKRKGNWWARKKYTIEYCKSRQEWFSASEITASSAQGCGSCGVLEQIIQNLFSRNEQGLTCEYEFSVSLDFELRRRPLGREGQIEIVQLFQPPGM